ncbi:MAG TPA: histidine kinase [Bryobacteraceae bacterium]|nr:histidine kinase [Bryobacteraceae bacterium]HPT26191.1 histidine kinase [Bryobacteraceae bacterium]
MMTLDVIQVIGRIIFGFGALAFSGLTLLWFRQHRQPHWPWPSPFYPWLFSILAGWFVLNLATGGFLVLLAAACVFPPLLHRLSERRGAWATSVLAAFIAAAALAAEFVGRSAALDTPLSASYLTLLGLALFASIRPGSSSASRIWFAIAALAAAVAAVWVRHPALTLFLRSLPLAFLFVESYERRRFLFLDLFVKWVAYYLIALSAVFGLITTAQGRLPAFVLSLALLPLLYLIPAICGIVGGRLDRVLWHRPMQLLEAQRLFIERTQSAATEPALAEQAGQALGEIFGAPARVLHESAPITESAARAAIRSRDRSLGWLSIGHRADRRPYFSQDHQLLDTLAALYATALENRRAQLRAVQAQINPHFLFNSLNTIASLIHDDPERAESTVLRLAGVFRHALERARSEWTTLESEFAFIADCIAVERERFGALDAEILLPEELKSTRIPSMALHILVENAFKHGISKAAPPRRIEISATRQSGRLLLRVADNGPSLSRPYDSSGRGLAILEELLHRHYGPHARSTLARDETAGLTVALLEIPA